MKASPLPRLALALCTLATPVSQATVPGTPVAQIRAAAEQWVAGMAEPGVVVHARSGHLDPRLNLPRCAGELTPFLPPGASVRARTTVGVRCPGAAGWSIYLPVTVESEARVLVARRPLGRGEIPAPADVELAERRVPGLPAQFLLREADIAGRRLRQAIDAGEPLPAGGFAAAILVERGQQVTVTARLDGLVVRSAAVAREAGSHGDRIRAVNPVSGRVIEGVVQADGTLSVAAP